MGLRLSAHAGPVLGLPTRLAVLSLLFTALCFGTAGFLGNRHLSQVLYEAEVSKARATLEVLSSSVLNGRRPNEYGFATEVLSSLGQPHSSQILYSTLEDGAGRLIASSTHDVKSGRLSPALFVPTFLTPHTTEGRFLYAFGPDRQSPRFLDATLLVGEQPGLWTIRARFSLDGMAAELHRRQSHLVPLTVLSGAIAWMIAVGLLHGVVLRPLRSLVTRAKRIQLGTSRVLAGLEKRDAMEALSQSLTEMTSIFEQKDEELQKEVSMRTAVLESENEELHKLVHTDALTGLKNRRYLEDSLSIELKRSSRHPRHLVLCMFDIDYFKTFNDLHGHQAGDTVLRSVAQRLLESLRSTDVLARYGGEEFVALLHDTNPDEGLVTAAKLCRAIRDAKFPGEEFQPNGKLTISVGVASFPEDGTNPHALIRAADIALYEAKRLGRNRVVRFSRSIEPPEETGSLPAATPSSPRTPSDEAPMHRLLIDASVHPKLT